ncbi:MAG: CxxxxCH/CxxCH domain-containing protein [Deltaproteobacteria bacterium]|nr:CxxxxCH/CxxCH domain-containing protein [Candidatus Deferrimicrobium borealis]
MTTKMRTLRNFRNPIGVLILLAAFAVAAGCSTANTTGGGVVVNHVDAAGNSVPGWVTTTGGSHANSATMDYIANGGSSSCTECHGSDLSGGTSKVSCFGNTAGCHHGPIPNWATPAVHGATAKKAPGSSGFASCQICHGADFRTVRGGSTCFTCHTTAPHAPRPWRGAGTTHTDTDPANAPVCAQCHYPNSPNNPANHPATPAPAGTAPGCFNSTLCHGDAAGHPAGWVAVPPALQPHGTAAKAANGYPGCQTCHGANFTGSGGAVSCLNTTGCHGAGVASPHPPRPWDNAANYTHTDTSTAGSPGNLSVCANCHLNGANLTTFPPPSPPAPPSTPPGCFNGTLCHSGGGAAPHPVPYNDNSHYTVDNTAFTANCLTCHDVSAPSTKAGPVCQSCHVGASPLAAANCTSCHASPPNGGAPAGAAYPNIAGAHTVHLALNSAGSPVTCDTCHNGLGPSLANENHYDRAKSRIAPGDVAFLTTYNASSGTSTFDNSAALSCSNVSCHGALATPNWQTGAINVNTQCTSCHTTSTTTTQFNGPTSSNHNRGAHQVACTICHNTTTLAVNHFTNLSTTALEGPASATIGGTGTLITTWVPATQSCTPSCHGNETW